MHSVLEHCRRHSGEPLPLYFSENSVEGTLVSPSLDFCRLLHQRGCIEGSCDGEGEGHTLSTGQEIEVLGTSIQDAFQLKLAQLPVVHNVVTDAVVDGVGAARQLYGTAHIPANFNSNLNTKLRLGGLPKDLDGLLHHCPAPQGAAKGRIVCWGASV